jgi:hypothetical protein
MTFLDTCKADVAETSQTKSKSLLFGVDTAGTDKKNPAANLVNWAQWYFPTIPATWEAAVGKLSSKLA